MPALPKYNPNQRKKAAPPSKAVPVPTVIVEPPKEEVKVLPKTPARRPVAPKRPAPVPVVTDEEAILAKINHRQRQVIVHSVIYYRLNDNLITDEKWNEWARELVSLQKTYPAIAVKSVFWEDMKDFDPSTGFHLANHPWGLKVAPALLSNLHNGYM